MKFSAYLLHVALSAVAVAVIGWSAWSTTAVAQDAENHLPIQYSLMMLQRPKRFPMVIRWDANSNLPSRIVLHNSTLLRLHKQLSHA
ncbi:MAG: hypothetical protein H6823_19635 [Planctomycetaceae bacterium]|nr:hypothetical protein [Planctomycetaceae bacterium]